MSAADKADRWIARAEVEEMRVHFQARGYPAGHRVYRLCDTAEQAIALLEQMVDDLAGEQEDPQELERALGRPGAYRIQQARTILRLWHQEEADNA